MSKELSADFIERLNAVTSKRPRTVIHYILENGFATTEDIKKLGHEHAPRAARDFGGGSCLCG